MPAHFEPHQGGAAIALGELEIALLRSYAEQLLDLLGTRDKPDTDDLLATAFHHGPSEPPQDPVLARLFPNAYTDLAEASAEFRRFTENDLHTRKRSDAEALINTLDKLDPPDHGRTTLHLTPEESRQWLGALNDLRLAIATRLDLVTEDDHEALLDLPETDPRTPVALTYTWLTYLQDTLVETLMP